MEDAKKVESFSMLGSKALAKEATVRYNALIDLILKFRSQGLGLTSISKKLAKDGIINERTEKPWSNTFIRNCIARAEREGKVDKAKASLEPGATE